MNDGKHKRKSRRSQKGENEHKKPKDFECNEVPKVTEQHRPTSEAAEKQPGRAKERRLKPAESKKQLRGMRSLLSGQKLFREWAIKQRIRGELAISGWNSSFLPAAYGSHSNFCVCTLSAFILSVLFVQLSFFSVLVCLFVRFALPASLLLFLSVQNQSTSNQ
jgi:hypothetical protein